MAEIKKSGRYNLIKKDVNYVKDKLTIFLMEHSDREEDVIEAFTTLQKALNEVLEEIKQKKETEL